MEVVAEWVTVGVVVPVVVPVVVAGRPTEPRHRWLEMLLR